MEVKKCPQDSEGDLSGGYLSWGLVVRVRIVSVRGDVVPKLSNLRKSRHLQDVGGESDRFSSRDVGDLRFPDFVIEAGVEVDGVGPLQQNGPHPEALVRMRKKILARANHLNPS